MRRLRVISIPADAQFRASAERRQASRRAFWRSAATRMHVARIGSETIESNLPLRFSSLVTRHSPLS
jgi:hypothetical protein